MDTQLFLDVNRFQVGSSWAHGIFLVYATKLGLIAIALCALIGALQGRREAALVGNRELSVGLWALCSAAISLGLGSLIAHFVGRARPSHVLAHLSVLGPSPTGSGMPSVELAAVGALITGLWLSRRFGIAILASVLGVLLAYARVYIAANYPSDVLAGLGLGAFVTLVLSPIASRFFSRWIVTISPTKAGLLVGAHHPTGSPTKGPASSPSPLAPSGSVRILSDHSVATASNPVVHGHDQSARSS